MTSLEHEKPNVRPRIAVGLSGGIDSAVAALLLQEQGHEVIAVTLRMKACGDEAAVAQAGAVAAQLGIRHEVADCRARFESTVMRPCWDAFERGATPNPCVLCNASMKFGEMLTVAQALGASLVATGHYARLAFDAQGRPLLRRGLDPNKDQTYFLHAVSPETLRHVRFPLGGLAKPDVRAIAAAHGLVNAKSAESQDICFAGPDGHFAEQLRQQFHGRAIPGVFVDEDGKVLGRHAGIHQYTIGQRRGMGFATGARVKIIAINPATGTIIVSGRPEAACAPTCHAENFCWHREPLAVGARMAAQVRYRQKAVTATLEAVEDGERTVRVRFDEPVFGVTPGQSLVLYDGDLVLGGGSIVR
ncbi:MAG TPA: tRNA 2-thiouridine(34) synthase MnmA [Kiritimatiellia bacterium]|nr:tRNA 2-thiouridine(34) synthase MnmA [Kiritimatiellia bacterium]HPS09617.1 tRNA 2-thiouridine(34) synthase MnmA [Kiritimatiellia bacterium]